MRFVKITLAISLVIIITLSSIFFSRSLVVTSLVNSYLAQYHSVLTCIDFSLDANDDLMISRLCIDSPYAEIELHNALIEWHFEPSYFQGNKIADAISAIHISSANVRAKGDIIFPESVEEVSSTLTTLPAVIRQKLHTVTLLTFPVKIDIQSLVYHAFSDHKDRQLYQGQFSATDQQLLLSLSDPEEGEILSLEVTQKQQGFNAKLSTELSMLRQFLLLHQTLLPADFSNLLTNKKNENYSVSGGFESEINWDDESLRMTSQFNRLSFETDEKIWVDIGASLAWETSLEDEILRVDFDRGNNLHLAFDQPALINLLTEKTVAPSLIEFLTNNAMDSFNAEPSGSLKVDFAKKTINSDGVVLTSNNLNESITLSVNDIDLSYSDTSSITANLRNADFSFDGQVKLAQLNSYTQQPVIMNITGGIEQQSDFWQLELMPSSVIELSQLALPVALANSNIHMTNQKVQPSLKKLLSHWQGNVTIPKSKTQNKSADIEKMSFDLHITNQINQLNLPKVAKVKTLELDTTLNGSLTDIAIKVKAIADELPIASAKVTGDIMHPQIEVQAKDLFIADLLALSIELPIEAKLIDGMLDYRLSGQIQNTDHFLENLMHFSVSVKDLTGELDGTWLQELNWQQKFIIQNGQVNSIYDDIEPENNLTITKIETATPITNLSTQTRIDFEHNDLTIKVNNTSGNLLGGRFDITQALWPFSKGSAVNVKLTKIDLEEVLELDKKQGIVVTGRVSGQLPIYYDGEHFLITEGSLHNVGDGLIQVFNNPAVEELKTSNTELKLAFDALENLHYHYLTSDVSMADDGYMLLDTAIKGRNPDLDNEVNLNLNLSYDLLGLLESLNITEHFESKVIKGLQKKN